MNKIIIITAPSGSGKTSVTKFLLNRFDNLCFSVSFTTRTPRNTEVDGIDYRFVSVKDFQQKISQDEFIEWEMVYDEKYYGTSIKEIKRIWDENKVPLLELDVKGAIRIKQQFPESVLTIFIEPPSIEELKKRLENRGTESPESLNVRVSKALYELSYKDQFDEVIYNDDLKIACDKAMDVVNKFI